uniref:Uncharacterized protein n=1 Tax=Mantoniella antarctica TaxID=81844 RepID=A0A7S0XCS2_9CHLO
MHFGNASGGKKERSNVTLAVNVGHSSDSTTLHIAYKALTPSPRANAPTSSGAYWTTQTQTRLDTTWPTRGSTVLAVAARGRAMYESMCCVDGTSTDDHFHYYS